ncbi:putative DNA methylase [Cercophora samala]|uniref:DNA (cytosine-5-)-methyltransferase n=1 Tax=Cercophora samala TaxID=330535 RepID=A0AA40DG02_9PEZI|nr:putative DNA methylase [Cercophora samala]
MTMLDSWPSTGHDETEAAILDQLRPLLPATLDLLPLFQGQDEHQQLSPSLLPLMLPEQCRAILPDAPPLAPASLSGPKESSWSPPPVLPDHCRAVLPDAPCMPPAPLPEPEESASSVSPESPEPPEPQVTISEPVVVVQTPDTLAETPESFLSDVIPPRQQLSVEIPVSTLVTPRSQHDGFVPPFPVTKERTAVKALLDAHGPMEGDFIEFDLDQFSFYLDTKHYRLEMRSLQHIDMKSNSPDRYYFDGILSCKGQKFYVQKVEVTELPIGNYGTEHPSVDGEIWVRSIMNSRNEIYYRLRRPTTEYRRFFEPFVWATDLAKHVVDYAGYLLQQKQSISLAVLKESFSEWLESTHGRSATFRKWRQQYPRNDFRTAVVSNIDFIWKEVFGVHGPKKAGSMRLFLEARDFSMHQKITALPALPVLVEPRHMKEDYTVAPTIVTPYINELFGHMVLGKVFHVVESPKGGLRTPVPARQATPECQIRLESKVSGRRRGTTHFLPLEVTDHIQVGDTISTPHDDETTDTKWKKNDGATDLRWFGLVQKVHKAKDGTRSFDVTWLYRPAETPCCLMRYPWPNELFLSDHCTCEEGHRARVKEHEVVGVHKVNWFGSPETSGDDFFVRQTYIVEHRRWVSLQDSHIRCSHGSEKLSYKPGDTVLVLLNPSDKFTEPCEIVKVFKQGKTVFVRLRRLLRRGQVDPLAKNAPANELVYTDKFVVAKPDKIIGKCHIRVFEADAPIPSPYNRNGTGNLFYITHGLAGTQSKTVPLHLNDIPFTMRQGFDPREEDFQKLRGMDLFCGSGNLGRGLEDGGVIEMRWAADNWDRAIHTYMANTPHQNTTHPFYGSVDDLLRLGLEGKFSDSVPRPGDVDFISAGSPCPGFSLLTINKKDLKQTKNQSMVASFAAFIDFYRPKYALLENVASIVQAHHNRTQDTLSQLFCAVIGLGYQAQLVNGDAWTHGAPQSRNRVFLLIAAPDARLPEAPQPSHSHYPGTKQRGIGKLCNGEAYVRRFLDIPTPFKYVSSSEATADLPDIIDGIVDACVSHPDHRLSLGYTEPIRRQVAVIPIFPYAMNFVKSWNEGKGVMTAADRELFPVAVAEKGRSRVASTAQGWSRLAPSFPFFTIKTSLHPGDARTGGGLHWRENRPFSVLEARRAQGFLDEEVLLGSQLDKWKLVGNSVSRHMALALGLKFREAWVGGLEEGGKRVSREGTIGVSEGSVGDIAVEEQLRREVWEEMAGLVVTDVDEGEVVRINGHGKRVLEEDVVAEGEHVSKMQRIEEHAEVISLTSTSDAQSGSDQAFQSLPSPCTSPEKSPERRGPTIVRILEDDEEH